MLQEFCASQPEMDKVVNTTMEEFSVSRREGKPMECKSEREDTISESYHVAGVLSVTKLERRADQHPEGPEEERKEQGRVRLCVLRYIGPSSICEAQTTPQTSDIG